MDEEYIMTKIRELMPSANHVPHGVLYSQIKTAVQKDLAKNLNNLMSERKITYSKTLNDLLINIKDE